MASVLGRELALPAFYHHRWVGNNATYHFNTTFNADPFFHVRSRVAALYLCVLTVEPSICPW